MKGETVGSAMPGDAVIAQNYDNGFSVHITLPTGLMGFVPMERLEYVGPYAGD